VPSAISTVSSQNCYIYRTSHRTAIGQARETGCPTRQMCIASQINMDVQLVACCWPCTHAPQAKMMQHGWHYCNNLSDPKIAQMRHKYSCFQQCMGKQTRRPVQGILLSLSTGWSHTLPNAATAASRSHCCLALDGGCTRTCRNCRSCNTSQLACAPTGHNDDSGRALFAATAAAACQRQASILL
jgi:hypothetical protein